MAKKEFDVEFTFVSTKADGDDFTRVVTVKADDAKSAADSAWYNRHSHFGALGTENAIDCRVVERELT